MEKQPYTIPTCEVFFIEMKTSLLNSSPFSAPGDPSGGTNGIDDETD